ETERAYCDAKARPEVHYALRFAAKEAVAKALGTGFSDGVSFSGIEIVNNRYGKPEVLLTGGAQRVAEEKGIVEMQVSLSFTHDVGVANAIAITEAARPRAERGDDQRARLDAAFKEARKMIREDGALHPGFVDAGSPSEEDDDVGSSPSSPVSLPVHGEERQEGLPFEGSAS
ncbi:MAG: holo-ACP synthase, partial [Coriobacteriales bacterium]|nr:holo-ACP synthase [Coriobacteriales bacterium]